MPGDNVGVHCTWVSPKLCSQWQGPAEVLAQLSEAVYRIRMPGQRRTVVLGAAVPVHHLSLLLWVKRRS